MRPIHSAILCTISQFLRRLKLLQLGLTYDCIGLLTCKRILVNVLLYHMVHKIYIVFLAKAAIFVGKRLHTTFCELQNIYFT